jgi:hypothetical protein
LAEKEAWKFMAEKKPAFTLNTVLPNINFGASLDSANQGSPVHLGHRGRALQGESQLPMRDYTS